MQKFLIFIVNPLKISQFSSYNILIAASGLSDCVLLIYAWSNRWFEAGVAKLGQRRWDEVPVLNGSQVRILPSALSTILIFAGAG